MFGAVNPGGETSTRCDSRFKSVGALVCFVSPFPTLNSPQGLTLLFFGLFLIFCLFCLKVFGFVVGK